MSTNPVDVPDAVMAAFTSAFGSVAKVKELEAKIAELETAKATVEGAHTVAKANLDAFREHDDIQRARIAELEAMLDSATFREGEVRGKLEMLVTTFKSVVGEAQAAVELIEPTPAPVAVANSVTEGNVSEPNTITTESTPANWYTKIAEAAFKDQRVPDPTTSIGDGAPVDSSLNSADTPSVMPTSKPWDGSGEGQSVENPTAVPFVANPTTTSDISVSETTPPFSVSSTTPQDTLAPASSTESPATPSATASSPSDTHRKWEGVGYWEKPEGVSWNEWYTNGGLVPDWINPNAYKNMA